MVILIKTSIRKQAFSLVEMMVAMFVFALLALAITKTLTYTKYIAEDNLYEATTLTVASSLIEQIKGASIDLLFNPTQSGGKDSFEMLIDGGTSTFLILDEFNDLNVPIVTEADGSRSKTLIMRVKPSITQMSVDRGFWIDVEYEYDHPRTQRTRNYTIRNARSTVPSS